MVLQRDLLTKGMRKGRMKAVGVLSRLARCAGLPEPIYDHRPGASKKNPSHFMKVTFRIPDFLRTDYELFTRNVVGGGKASQKAFAKTLAALEAVQRLEADMGLNKGELAKLVDKYEDEQRQKKEKIQSTPVEQEIQGVSWESFPIDPSFPDTDPATRRGRIYFNPELRQNPRAFAAAKAITLAATGTLPEVVIHGTTTDEGFDQYANIRVNGRTIAGGSSASEIYAGISRKEAELLVLDQMGRKQYDSYPNYIQNDESSFGMAKVVTQLPAHQFKEIKELMGSVTPYQAPHFAQRPHKPNRDKVKTFPMTAEDESKVTERISSFRRHQLELSLPVDSVEDVIPHDAPVTVVKGGTGSGKTTRYPLMLSLFSPMGLSTKVVVAQPRRLACQTAAHRVAYEIDARVGADGCPIGYAIRFESFSPKTECRTVNFQTPGVILRRAMTDPLLKDVTHLVIDEVHERNADVDLLLALAKDIQKQRANHSTLLPLRIVLMSATLDSSHWESYFGESGNPVAVVNMPEIRRFPIDIAHLGNKDFPLAKKTLKRLVRCGNRDPDEREDILWNATAELAVQVFQGQTLKSGSILCFLPGIEEIRYVGRLIRKNLLGRRAPMLVHLHSSLSSKEQARAFQPGPKIILSTNIAETSLTIPDVKVVIDAGKERQYSLLESRSDGVSVVGSQLTTVTISRASAKQRAGRAGRVSSGTCYRLYTEEDHKGFDEFTVPEMLRMDLSSLVLHSLSMYHPENGHSLQVLRNTPNPPTDTRLSQTLQVLEHSGFISRDVDHDDNVTLTPLGWVVSDLPTSPRIGRMLIMGLALGAIEPALDMAALLSVPRAFQAASRSQLFQQNENDDPKHCSDIVKLIEMYHHYLNDSQKERHPVHVEFKQASRIRTQLERSMKEFLRQRKTLRDLSDFNKNSERLAALAALICVVTPHIAHMVCGRMDFATRDVTGYARIHPGSVNAGPNRRTHWYLYDQLRKTKAPYMHLTTAVSPLELAIFSEASTPDEAEVPLYGKEINWLYVADQWVPVELSAPGQQQAFLRLRQLLTNDMLQQLAHDPESVIKDSTYQRTILFVLSAIEQQRLKS